MTVTTVQLTLVTIHVATMQLTLARTPDRTTRATICRTTRAPELNNGKQSTDMDKLDAVDAEQCRDTEKTGRHNKPKSDGVQRSQGWARVTCCYWRDAVVQSTENDDRLGLEQARSTYCSSSSRVAGTECVRPTRS
jgi:hypothetical protein